MNARSKIRRTLLGMAAVVLLGGGTLYGCQGATHSDESERTAVSAVNSERSDGDAAASEGKRYPVTIESSRRLGELDVEFHTPAGRSSAGVRCSTCHATKSTGPMIERPEELQNFHRGMEFDHGELTCNSCHSEQDRDKLKLANGKELAFADTMDLCGQCHGPQMRDYRNGAHGGMNGYWDLKQGPRTRNNCVNCHDPHDPAYPSVTPAPGPKDRFLNTNH